MVDLSERKKRTLGEREERSCKQNGLRYTCGRWIKNYDHVLYNNLLNSQNSVVLMNLHTRVNALCGPPITPYITLHSISRAIAPANTGLLCALSFHRVCLKKKKKNRSNKKGLPQAGKQKHQRQNKRKERHKNCWDCQGCIYGWWHHISLTFATHYSHQNLEGTPPCLPNQGIWHC